MAVAVAIGLLWLRSERTTPWPRSDVGVAALVGGPVAPSEVGGPGVAASRVALDDDRVLLYRIGRIDGR